MAFADTIVEGKFGINALQEGITNNPFLRWGISDIDQLGDAIRAVEPITLSLAVALLGLVALTEFIRMSSSNQQMNSGLPGLEMVFFLMLKVFVGVILVRGAVSLCVTTFEIGQLLTSSICDYVFPSGTAGGAQVSGVDLLLGEDADSTSTMALIALWISSAAQVFVTMFVSLFRIFVASIMAVVSPIALVALFNEDTKQFGIGFIRNFLALTIQGAVLVLIVYLYPFLSAAVNAVAGTAWGTSAFASIAPIIIQLVLVVMMVNATAKSSQISRQLVGA